VPRRFSNSRSMANAGLGQRLLPHMAGAVDDLAIVKSLHTEAINHGPGHPFIQTATSSRAAEPGGVAELRHRHLLAKLAGLHRDDLARLRQQDRSADLLAPLGSASCQPHQGVRFRSGQDPVLYLSNPAASTLRTPGDAHGVGDLNRLAAKTFGDPEINTRIASTRWPSHAIERPGTHRSSKEDRKVTEMYGIKDNGEDGGFARNCLLARRMVERGVRFVQLMHAAGTSIRACRQIRGQSRTWIAPAALIKDLKQRGLLDDTLVIWGGEFGRTVYSQAR